MSYMPLIAMAYLMSFPCSTGYRGHLAALLDITFD